MTFDTLEFFIFTVFKYGLKSNCSDMVVSPVSAQHQHVFSCACRMERGCLVHTSELDFMVQNSAT